MTTSIARTKAKLGNAGYHLPQTAELCKKALLMCTRQMKAAIQGELETHNLRKQHQESLIQQYETQGNSKLANKIQGMQKAEQVKHVYQRCRAARNLGTEGGLTHVLVPQDPNDNPRHCKTWKRIDNPTKMTQVLMA